VILLAGVFVVVGGMIGVAFVDDVTTEEEPQVSAAFGADGTNLTVSHLGGNTVTNGALLVIVDSDDGTVRLEPTPPDERFSTGDRRAFSDILAPRSTARVQLVHAPTGVILDRGTVTAGDGPTETGAIAGTVTGPGAASLQGSEVSFALRRSLTPLDGVLVVVSGPSGTVETTTGPNGGFRVDGLRSGPYQVSAAPTGFASAATTATVEANETATVDLTLEPLAPAEFAVAIDDVDARVDAGEPVVVNATVENIGDEEGTQTIDLSAAGAVVDEETITLAGGESRQISPAWQTLPTDVGEIEIAVASEDDAATTTVEVLDAETDAVAYVDRDEDGSVDETFTAAELAFLNELDGRFIVFDDADLVGSVGVRADRVVVEDGVSLSATVIELVGDDGVSLGDGSTLDASSERFLVADGGDVTVRSGGGIEARGATVTTAASGLFGGSAGDIDVSAAGAVDVSGGDFDATGRSLFGSGDGTIRIASDGGTVTATGAAFDPDPTIESDDE
jgi:hypothetical protein